LDQLKTAERDLRERERELSHVKAELGSLQSNLAETVEQLNEKTKICKQLKSQLKQSEKERENLSDEVSIWILSVIPFALPSYSVNLLILGLIPKKVGICEAPILTVGVQNAQNLMTQVL